MLNDIKVPLYDSSGLNEESELYVSEFAGRLNLTIKNKGIKEGEICIELMYDDLDRAWRAVKRY